MVDTRYGSLRRLTSSKSLRRNKADPTSRSRDVAASLRSLSSSPGGTDRAVDILSKYISAKQAKGRTSLDIVKRLENIQAGAPEELASAFLLARQECNLPVPSSRLRGRPLAYNRLSSMSVASLETLRTPEQSMQSELVDIFSPKYHFRLPMPSFRPLKHGGPLSVPTLAETEDFLPFSLSFADVSVDEAIGEYDKAEDDFDRDTLDDFPLPPLHIPVVSRAGSTSCPLGRASSVYDTPQTHRNAWSRCQDERGDEEDEDDDARTIIAMTPSSTDSGWSGEWRSTSSEDTYVEEESPSKASKIRDDYFDSQLIKPSQISPDRTGRCGIAL